MPATIIDALLVTLVLDATNFKKGSKEADDSLKKTREEGNKTANDLADALDKKATAAMVRFKNETLAVTAALIGAAGLTEFVSKTVSANIATGNMAKNLGMSANELNAWRRAADAAGGSADDMQAALQSIGKALEDYKLRGKIDDGPLKAFLNLHISYLDENGRVVTPEVAMKRIAGAMVGKSPQDQAFGLNTLLGFGAGVNPLLTQGASAITQSLNEMHKLGDTAANAAESSKQLNAEWVKLKASVDAAGTAIEHRVEGPLVDVLKFTQAIASGLADIANDKPRDPANRRRNQAAAREENAWLWDKIFGAPSLPPKPVSGKVVDEGAPPSAPAKAQQTPSSGVVAKMLANYGWSPSQIDGILANLMHESGMNPAAVGDHGKAYGIAQWHADRQADFKAWSGRSIIGSSLADQVAFLNHELTKGKEQHAGLGIRSSWSSGAAAALMSLLYERPADAIHQASARARTAQLIAANPSAHGVHHSETHIGQIVVSTKATDANGIAKDIGQAVNRHPLVAQANSGMQ